MVIAIWPKWHFEIWPVLCFLEDKMVSLDAIDFKLGLPLNINVNNGQNKFDVHISKKMARIAYFQQKIGQDATFTPTFNGHYSAIIYPILTYDHIKKISSSKRIEWC